MQKKLSLSTQVRILNKCQNENRSFACELERLGYSYDMLRYREVGGILKSKSRAESLGDFEDKHHGVPAISFFSGAGGLDLGFEAAGYSHLLSVENNELFCKTLRKNRPNWKIVGPPDASGDISNRKSIAETIHSVLNSNVPFEGVFHGGPPCQSFSIAANQRFSKEGDNFKRVGFSHEKFGNLLFDYIWLIQTFRPRAFLIENVPGLVTIDSGLQIQRALALLEDEGYRITPPAILNAADFGVPQERHRVIVIGWRGKGDYILPAQNNQKIPSMTVLGNHLNGAPNHQTREHTAESILRYMELGFGERDQLGRVDRLDPNKPSKTVIAGGTSGGGRSHLHPSIPRTISVREAARLQTFPDEYEFHGPTARQFTQVGNAVPPLFAYKLARSIFQSLFNK